VELPISIWIIDRFSRTDPAAVRVNNFILITDLCVLKRKPRI
jgi:hypothetical protein